MLFEAFVALEPSVALLAMDPLLQRARRLLVTTGTSMAALGMLVATTVARVADFAEIVTIGECYDLCDDCVMIVVQVQIQWMTVLTPVEHDTIHLLFAKHAYAIGRH